MISLLQLREIFEYLNDLREEGSCNMYGARGIIQETFDLPRLEAGKVLSAWMKTFDGKQGVSLERARKGYDLLTGKSKK